LKIIEINKLYYPWIGGVETHVQTIAENVSPLDRIEVICCNDTSITKTESINGVTVRKFGALCQLLSLPLSPRFVLHFFKLKADVLHLHLPNPLAVMAYWLARPTGRVVVTWHSDIIKQRFILFFYKPFLKWFLKRTSAIIATSPNMVQHSPFLRNHTHKTHVIPLGIDPKHYPTKATVHHQRYALFVGRLIYYKGVLHLVEALKKCNVTLIMIGEGPLQHPIKQTAGPLIESGQLTIKPFQDKDALNQYFNDCEFFVLPSTHASEAFGIVQLEAMIYSKPVISTQLPTGVPYVNQHNHTGIVVPPGDTNALASAMQLLWDSPTLRSTYGTNASNRCRALFTEEKMIQRTKEVLFVGGSI
jgi:rhamnosyl/mannosyltransferase